MAQLLGIAIRPAGIKGAIEEIHQGHIDTKTGLEGDKRNRPGRRQVTLIT
ncbi:MAG: hypothetical protein HUJ30_06485 [Gammaproteobacteria bacterium]|nr:hypothetical protein [Gammaproteobacteria bacterium]